MIESLPDRTLTQNEIEKLEDSKAIENIRVRGRDLTAFSEGIAEDIVITTKDGETHELVFDSLEGCWVRQSEFMEDTEE